MADSAFKKTIANGLYQLGFTANALTLMGLAAAGAAGILSYRGSFFAAGAALLLSGLLDMLDGAVARVSEKAGKFGGILDSTLDRYGDAFVLGGLLFFCARTGREAYALAAFAALAGSFAISYVRARAECAIESCRVGFWERGERIGLLVIALVLGNPAAALWILAVGTQITAFERLWEARRMTRVAGPAAEGSGRARQFRRGTPVYAAKVLFWVLLLVFFRPAF